MAHRSYRQDHQVIAFRSKARRKSKGASQAASCPSLNAEGRARGNLGATQQQVQTLGAVAPVPTGSGSGEQWRRDQHLAGFWRAWVGTGATAPGEQSGPISSQASGNASSPTPHRPACVGLRRPLRVIRGLKSEFGSGSKQSEHQAGAGPFSGPWRVQTADLTQWPTVGLRRAWRRSGSIAGRVGVIAPKRVQNNNFIIRIIII